jgi:Ca2+-binding EF-hand superfamily protein
LDIFFAAPPRNGKLSFYQSQRKQKKKRAVRQNSNVFAVFDQGQIAEFKEAFSMIDHDNDGFIDKEDLKDMLASLGYYY